MSRPDKIRAVAQQAHDDGDCVCCLPDPDTITITISREDAEIVADSLEVSSLGWDSHDDARVAAIFRAALKGER